ncbi:2-oxo acid dehydrogenase subunit E2 [Rubrobacter marinus]|uniref:Dihydrolipoamide acetyltransferase component of pyruvate dehydrogenase complex n=1 Tax=Rubrobacter marinus TaxID=2653852 RepID=A0A6G8PWF8_9ACTN|nr:dihydrolipoamide acetyltransferase family protein [Rubrobacter marinus]QIN78548.1 2-oxo acid dehydrogenase subunit E2 [Rubrobacter marinus]
MATELKVPKLGMDMEEANILRWIVEEGQSVEKGDPVLEIDTDKVSYEVEANADGVIRRVRGEEGETVPVGATLAYIAAPGEEFEEPVGANGASSPAAQPSLPDAAPTATEETREHRNGRRGVRASPAARRAAATRGIFIEDIPGSGPGGRIYLSDVLEADVRQATPDEVPQEAPPRTPAVPATGAQHPSGAPAPVEPPPAEDAERELLSRVRRVGAERTAKSFGDVPHFYLTRDLEADGLLELRERLKAKMYPALSLTELFALAIARTLKGHPRLNARYVDGGYVDLNRRVNLGIATATDEGLVVPVLKGADSLPLRELVPAVKELIGRAREGKLGADDLSGGTFTVSNLGMMGVDAFDAIINAPQAGILALGRVRTVPEWREGAWLPLRVISATLSVDHRVADGADGARFLGDLQAALSDWELLL